MDGNPSEESSGINKPLLNNQDSSSIDDGRVHYPEIKQSSSQDFSAGHGYNYGPRACRDIFFAILFLIVILATLGVGIFGIAHHNADFHWMESPHYFRNESRCSVTPKQASLVSSNRPERGIFDAEMRSKIWRTYANVILPKKLANDDALMVSLITSMVVTLVLSIPLVLGLVWLLRRYTKQLVYVSLPLFVLLPVALNIIWFVVCAKDVACQESLSLSVRILFLVFIFLFCAIIVWIIFANFARVELTVRVITTAAEALYRNLSLLIVIPGLSLMLLVFYVPAGVFLVFAYMNGKYVPNAALKERPDLPCGRGTSRDCCVWDTQAWVPAYITLAALAVLWTTFVIAQVKVYTISGTISQWYFAEANTHTVGALKKSLGQALSSSFGTLCFSGLVFAFVRLVRNAVDTATNSQEREGLALSLLRCCYDWLLKAIEFVTKFTVDFAAITGEGFCASAKGTFELLKRNLLSVAFVEVISTRLLGGVMFVVSIIYAVALWSVLRGTTDLDNRIYIVTLASWALLMLVLSIFIAVMNIIIDTVYICYAMDKDKGCVSKSEAHDVYVLLPVSQGDRASLAVQRQHNPV